MGKQNSKPKDLNEFLNETAFTKDELQAWYGNFSKKYRTGSSCSLTIDQFKNIYVDLFPNGDADLFAENAFRLFDVNNDEVIDFREFITALSVTRRGTIDERLRWVFNVYDKDSNGYISRHEMLVIVTAIFKMCRNIATLPRELYCSEMTPEELVLQMHKKMDKNRDGVLSVDEFIEGAKSNSMFLNILQSMII